MSHLLVSIIPCICVMSCKRLDSANSIPTTMGALTSQCLAFQTSAQRSRCSQVAGERARLRNTRHVIVLCLIDDPSRTPEHLLFRLHVLTQSGQLIWPQAPLSLLCACCCLLRCCCAFLPCISNMSS